MPLKKIIIACGGTGGHIFPALSVAEVLQEEGCDISVIFSGTHRGEVKPRAEWKGGSFLSGARPSIFDFRNLISILKCLRFLLKEKPQVIFATGGFTSAPPVIAARCLRIPVILHEANIIPGKAIRLLMKFCKIEKIAVSFKETLERLPENAPAVFTGFPVRKTFAERFTSMPPHQDVTPDISPFSILITGGSQGASAINRAASNAICSIVEHGIKELCVIHQCGVNDVATLETRYLESGVNAKVVPFISDMCSAYSNADIVIARAGASTCFELAFSATPAILIPLPTAKDNHQMLNAQGLVNAGGAICCKENEQLSDNLVNILLQLIEDPSVRTAMREGMKKIKNNNAAKEIVKCIKTAVK